MTNPTSHPWPTPIKALSDKWPSAVVTRERIGEFSGGLLHPRTMANLDCEKAGPPKLRFGRKVAYSVTDLCDWLALRVEMEG